MWKLYLERDLEAVDETRLAGASAVVCSRRCPGKETPNEDASAVFAVDESTCVLAIADGMGGGRAGRVAARLAIQSLQESLGRQLGRDMQLRAAVLDGIEMANRRILELGSGAATTLAVAEINGSTLRPYHVGDSMILVAGGRGRVRYQTISHSPVGFAVEAGVLDKDEALHHEDRHLVSNVVGSAEMRIEIGPTIGLAPRDTALLGSDGLFDNLLVDEILLALRQGSLAESVLELARMANERMTQPQPGKPSKPDDATILAYRQRSGTRRP